MSTLSATCPTCEYQSGNPGRPVRRGEFLHCLDCGNDWKVFGKRNSEKQVMSERPTFASPSAEEVPTSAMEIVGSSPEPSISTAFLVATAAMVIFGGTVGGAIYGIGTLAGVTNDNSLKFERVAFEELMHGSGGKVVRVRGTIRNPGSTPAVIPGVSIVLRSANGNEITRWKHISRTLRLQPGETTHFVSAKPLDYSIVSSVDAQFD